LVDRAAAPLVARLRACGVSDQALVRLETVREPLGLSVRGVLLCARVARTIAALDGVTTVEAQHINEALTYRREAVAALQPSAHTTY
jgi:predicted ATPase with chaperone activity